LVSEENLKIRVSVWLWRKLVFELRKRSAGHRESGAFLVGSVAGTRARVTSFVCYDDLDPDAYQHGAIAFHAVGYAALWQHCRSRKLDVLADIHTHPGGVRQSPTDQENPMLPLVGHTALIMPRFARTPWWSLRTLGVYEYLGDGRWCDHIPGARKARFALMLW